MQTSLGRRSKKGVRSITRGATLAIHQESEGVMQLAHITGYKTYSRANSLLASATGGICLIPCESLRFQTVSCAGLEDGPAAAFHHSVTSFAYL